MRFFARRRRVVLWMTLAAALAVGSVGTAFATHARPGGGTPWRSPLVVAYQACGVLSNATHIGPYGSPSCSPPVQESPLMTTSSTGAGSGSVRLDIVCTDGGTPPCNQADAIDSEDATLQISNTDVSCPGSGTPGCTAAGADYGGKYAVDFHVRLTDHANPALCASGTGAPPCTTATVQDFAITFVSQCATNAPGPPGSNCSTNTSLDTWMPGTVRELQRGSFELLSFQILDPGPDGTYESTVPTEINCPPTCGTGDEKPYQRAGWFAP